MITLRLLIASLAVLLSVCTASAQVPGIYWEASTAPDVLGYAVSVDGAPAVTTAALSLPRTFGPGTYRVCVASRSVTAEGPQTCINYTATAPAPPPPPPPPTPAPQPVELCGNGKDDNGNGQIDEGCAPPPPPPPVPTVAPPVVTPTTCKISVANKPDARTGWGVQFTRDGVNIGGRDTTAPYERTVSYEPGPHTWQAIWTKSGLPAITVTVSTQGCQ